MSKLSRRDFLKTSALGVGAVTLGGLLDACGHTLPSEASTTPAPLSSTDTPPATSSSPTQTQPEATEIPAASTSTPTVPPYLVVAHGGEPEELVRRAIAALGGMQKFVTKGAKVIVKPNICVDYHTYEYAATTNPWVVGTLVKMCYEAGAASVKVMDSPFGGTQQHAFEITGIKEQVEAAGGEMAYMLPYKYVDTEFPKALVMKKNRVYDDILNADVIINVPIAKQHSSARLTIGMKNLMGVVWDRAILHTNLGQSIADLNSLIRPQLTIVDAIRILTANGPTGGYLADVKKLDTVIASPDIVAADSYATTFFGLKPENLEYIVAGTAMGLGRSDLLNLKIEQIALNG